MVISDADFLALKARVNNISNELGSDPSGVFSDIAQRVDSIETDVQDIIDDGPAPLLLTGDVTGNTSANTVIKIQNRNVSATAPTDGQSLVWDNTNSIWKPAAAGGFTAAGDLSGSSSSQTVIAIRNQPVSNVSPSSGYVLTWDGAKWEAAPGGGTPTLLGDVTGNTGASVVSKVRGATVGTAAGALTTGNVLKVTGASAIDYGAVNLAGGAGHVTGTLPNTNLPDGTTGAKGIVQLAGDLSGTASSVTVSKINGTTVPAGGSLTTGTILRVTGSAAMSFGSLDLANAVSVTGILPAANHPDASTGAKGIVQLAGDIAGTSTSVTVAKVNGTTVPAGGSLTTGNGLYVTGVGALSYSALNLAGGANYVSGILPSANLFQATTGTSGAVRLTGDLAGTAASPTVVDLTIASEATGSMLYFNGTNWVNRSTGTANTILTANGAAAPTWNSSITAMTDIRSTIFSLDPASGSAGNSRVFYDTFSTTSNTQFTARTISFAAGFSAVITCCISGVDAYTGGGGTNRVISITKSGKYYRASAGSLVISGSSTVQDLTPAWGDNQAAIDLSFVISSNDLQIKVTGENSLNAKWSMETVVRLVAI